MKHKESDWDEVRNRFFNKTMELSNFMQHLTTANLGNPSNIKKIIALRFQLTQVEKELFRFVHEESWSSFMQTLNYDRKYFAPQPEEISQLSYRAE